VTDRLLSLSEYPVIVMTPDCTLVSVSRQIVELLGYEREELVGQNINIIMPPAIAYKHDQIVAAYMSSRRTNRRRISSVVGQTRPVVAQHKTGRPVQIFLSVRSIEGDAKSSLPVMFVGQFRLAETEVGLRAAVVEAQLLEKVFPFPYIETDEKGMIIRFNPAAEYAFGTASSVAVGKNIVILMPEKIMMGGKSKTRRLTHHRIMENYVQKVRDVGTDNVKSRIVDGKTTHKAVRVNQKDTNSLATETFDIELEVNLALNAQGQFRFRAFVRVQETFMNYEEVMDTVVDHIFPEPVAERIKEGEVLSAGSQDVTIIFADIVGFTSLLSMMEDEQTITVLNDLWSRFASIKSVIPGFYPIKTNYDEMMICTGLFDDESNHAEEGIKAAFFMLEAVKEHNAAFSNSISVRIGICSGPVILSVSDGFRMNFDLIGETTVLASRAEGTGKADHIHITESTYMQLEKKTQMKFSQRDEPVYFKNVGSLTTYLSVTPKGRRGRRRG
jgi:PAS domain S-box-containing protein